MLAVVALLVTAAAISRGAHRGPPLPNHGVNGAIGPDICAQQCSSLGVMVRRDDSPMICLGHL